MRILQRDVLRQAALAQLVEQLICNQQVIGSTPVRGSNFHLALHALYQGKRARSGAPDVSRWFSLNRVIWAHFSFSRGPSVAQEAFSLPVEPSRAGLSLLADMRHSYSDPPSR